MNRRVFFPANIGVEPIHSTNEYVMTHDARSIFDEEGETFYPDKFGFSLLAENQTGGKGKNGSVWVSPDRGMYLTLLIYAKLDPRYSIIAAVAAAEAIDEIFSLKSRKTTKIKWCNDLLFPDKSGNLKKVCGILCESKPDRDLYKIAIGYGLNLEGEFDKETLPNAASMYNLTGKQRITAECGEVFTRSFAYLEDRFREDKNSFDDILKKYKERCVTIGKEVLVNGEKMFAKDIAPDGGLVCEFDGVVKTVYSGEVTVRGINGEYF